MAPGNVSRPARSRPRHPAFGPVIESPGPGALPPQAITASWSPARPRNHAGSRAAPPPGGCAGDRSCQGAPHRAPSPFHLAPNTPQRSDGEAGWRLRQRRQDTLAPQALRRTRAPRKG
jgi:hypothetical protein